MKVALWPLRMNVVRANAARPRGAGSAGFATSTNVLVGATSAVVTAMCRLLSPVPTRRRGTLNGIRYFLIPKEKSGEPSALRGEVVRILRQVLGAVLRDEDEVLEPDAAVALPVAPRLDGDDIAGAERQL